LSATLHCIQVRGESGEGVRDRVSPSVNALYKEQEYISNGELCSAISVEAYNEYGDN
jgi:hypothetical protein